MFARRNPVAAAARGPAVAFAIRRAPALSAAPAALAALATRPRAAAFGALALFIGAAGLLVAVSGDPRAGAPSVRVSLARPKPRAPSADPAAGARAFTVDTLGMYQDLAVPGFEGADTAPIHGQAVITLPAGASAGAQSSGTVSGNVSGQASGQISRPALPPRRGPVQPLPASPLPGLVQPGPLGPLPVVAGDRSSFSAYARPFRPDGRPRVALIVGGLGLNPAATRVAIERLPPEITLSFVPYAQGLQGWIDLARANGHEVMIEIPMEPADYPDNDPGPYTLLANAPAADVSHRLEWLLSRATGYFGVTNYLGQKFVSSDVGMAAFLSVLKSRGVAFMDDGSARRRSGAFARGSADAVIDDQLTADAISGALSSLEQTAKVRGQALGTGFAYPLTVELAARWADALKAHGLQLAPASAMARR